MSRRFIALATAFIFIIIAIASCASGEADANAETLPIVSGGATDYVIVRNDLYHSDNMSVRAAVRLKQAIRAVTGVDIELKTDWDGKEDFSARKEILVGVTNRKETKEALELIGTDQFIIKVCGDGTKIVITGKDDESTDAAVNYFCENYLGYKSQTEYTEKAEFGLPLDLEVLRSYIFNTDTDGIAVGSEEEAALIFQDAGTIESGKRKFSGSEVLIYKLNGNKGGSYTLTLNIEGQYLVTVSPDNKTYARLFAYTDEGYKSTRGSYTADLTEYFANSDTVYIRISDYKPTDVKGIIIYSLNFAETDN